MLLLSFSFISNNETNENHRLCVCTYIVDVVCDEYSNVIWTVRKLTINRKFKIMETNNGEHWPADTEHWPSPSPTQLNSFWFRLDLALVSLYSNKLWISTPKCILLRILYHHIQNHTLIHTHIEHIEEKKYIYQLLALLKVEWITVIKYKKTYRPLCLLLYAWVDRYMCVLCAFTQNSNIIQYYYVFFFFMLCMVVSNRRNSHSYHPNHYYSTPMYVLFFSSSSMHTIDFNFIIETYYNIQYKPCKRYFFLSLALRLSFPLSLSPS